MQIEPSTQKSTSKKVFTGKVRQRKLSKVTYRLFDVPRKESGFLVLVAVLLMLCQLVAPYPHIAMWFGFAIASYSAIANDSIQTLGTFIASNAHRHWKYVWLFMGLIFVGTVTYSWIIYDGDVSYQRLAEKGFAQAPQTFSFPQLFAPIALLILTRLQIPVSTTFLVLNVFATDPSAMFDMLQKSFYGYTIALIVAAAVWYLVARLTRRHLQRKPSKFWVVSQWVTSGSLWSVWIMQDAANLAVFLPRQLSLLELCAFVSSIFFGLGLLLYLKGDRMQKLVNEKVGLTDIRAATLVDLVYMVMLFYFKCLNNVPMSTTWVFIGLLAGRELAIGYAKKRPEKRAKALKKGLKFVKKDLRHALTGLVISMLLALWANPVTKIILKDFILRLFAL